MPVCFPLPVRGTSCEETGYWPALTDSKPTDMSKWIRLPALPRVTRHRAAQIRNTKALSVKSIPVDATAVTMPITAGAGFCADINGKQPKDR